ncbi:reverse transcriptase domain-containing protein [Tanacetum coccineum]|uniref:Reverse transcriptase domain-containing protein n=1 Tax=Tanacetum coccineum TaxID=301880 RepID=A0ABQ5EUX8_9ASTR
MTRRRPFLDHIVISPDKFYDVVLESPRFEHSTLGISPDVAELKDKVKALLLEKKNQTQAPTPVKAVKESCVTCGGTHSYRNCPATDGNVYRDNIQEYVSQAATANFNQGNSGYRAPIANQIRPPSFPPNQNPNLQNQMTNLSDMLSKFVNSNTASTLGSGTLPNNTITNPKVDLKVERRTRGDKGHWVLLLIWKLPKTSLNLGCPRIVSAVILNKLPEKLRDPSIFLIPCDFPGMDKCLALADLGASINLMPLSVWKKLSLLELTPTCMTLELADRSITKPIGIAEDTGCALIDVYEGELTLRVRKEAITFNLDQTSRYSSNYDDMTANRIDVIEMAYEDYSQEVLGFFDVIASGNPTPYYDPIISTSSPTLTPFGDSDFLLEEVDAFLALEDDPISPEVDDSYYDPEGDILLLDIFSHDVPSPPTIKETICLKIQKNLKFVS